MKLWLKGMWKALRDYFSSRDCATSEPYAGEDDQLYLMSKEEEQERWHR